MSADLEKLRIDRTRTAARRPARGGPRWLVPAILLLVLVAVGFVFQRPLRNWIDSVRLPPVHTVVVTERLPSAANSSGGKAANGYIVAARRAALSADTPGRIVEMRVTEGSLVRKDEVVARLYSAEYEADVAHAQSEVVVAEAALEEVRRQRDTAQAAAAEAEQSWTAAKVEVEAAEPHLAWLRRERDRFERLLAEGTATEQEWDRARSEHETEVQRLRTLEQRERLAKSAHERTLARRAELDSAIRRAEAQVHVQRARRDRAQATLDKTEVCAPFDGLVVLKDAEVGEVVSPNSQGGSNARGSVCTLVDLESLEVQADVPESSLSAVRLGGAVRIFLDAEPDREHRGIVSRIWPTANRQKATVEVRIRFEELDESFRPEMSVRVVFLPEDAPEPEVQSGVRVIQVPESAVVRTAEGSWVYVLERDRAIRRDVAVTDGGAGRVTVERGLSAGETIVRDPPADLDSGDRVKVIRD